MGGPKLGFAYGTTHAVPHNLCIRKIL